MEIPWDGTGINCYGLGQINTSHGQLWKYDSFEIWLQNQLNAHN